VGRGEDRRPGFCKPHPRVRLSELKGVGGSYAAVLYLPAAAQLAVGRLGALHFARGGYIYCGSARGPGGLAARLGHHLRHRHESPHWHLDYLRPHCRLKAFWVATDPAVSEHGWAGFLAGRPEAHMPAPGFGASDCRCPAHLVHFPTLAGALAAAGGMPADIYRVLGNID